MKESKILMCCVVILVSISSRVLSQQLDVFRIGSSGDFLRPKGVSSTKVQEIYVDSAWAQTTVIIEKNDRTENVSARYELRSNQLEIKTANGVGVLDVRVIRSFTAVDRFGNSHEFINGKEFTIDGTPLRYMIEILSHGKISLYKSYGFYIKKPDYNATLSVGNPDEQVFSENKLYYLIDKALVSVPVKKKKLLELFGDRASQVENYISQNNFNLSKELSLIAVFNYFNRH